MFNNIFLRLFWALIERLHHLLGIICEREQQIFVSSAFHHIFQERIHGQVFCPKLHSEKDHG